MKDKPLTEPLTEINPIHWDMIMESVRGGFCVPFLGAGANVRSRDEGYPYAGLPLADKVALELVNKLMALDAKELQELAEVKSHESFKKFGREDLLKLTLHNLARVALHVEVESNFDFRYLLNLLQKLLSGETRPSKLLETIAHVETLQLIVTTNYDKLMECALEGAHRPYEPVVQPIDGFYGEARTEVAKRLVRAQMEPKRLILYKIHGTFPDTQPTTGSESAGGTAACRTEAEGERDDAATAPKPSRIIITEDDYIKFLTVVGIKDVGVPAQVSQIITDSTLLFLGYSLEDWDFRTIYKGIHEALPHIERRTSFAIQKNAPPFWVDFWKGKGVIIYDMDVYRFADELKKKCQESGLYREQWAADKRGE
jgi:hypothetical protein